MTKWGYELNEWLSQLNWKYIDQSDSYKSPWKTGFYRSGAPVASHWAFWAQCERRQSHWNQVLGGSASPALPSAVLVPGINHSLHQSIILLLLSFLESLTHFINQLSVNKSADKSNSNSPINSICTWCQRAKPLFHLFVVVLVVAW